MPGMTEIGITEFKATCAAVFERVRETRQPVLVTRFGQPVARIVPPPPGPPSEPPPPRADWLGCMKDRTEIKGDIVSPAADPSEWGALSR